MASVLQEPFTDLHLDWWLRRPLGSTSLLAHEQNAGVDANGGCRRNVAQAGVAGHAASPTASSVSAGVVRCYSEPLLRLLSG